MPTASYIELEEHVSEMGSYGKCFDYNNKKPLACSCCLVLDFHAKEVASMLAEYSALDKSTRHCVLKGIIHGGKQKQESKEETCSCLRNKHVSSPNKEFPHAFYMLHLDEHDIFVCRSTFMNVFGIRTDACSKLSIQQVYTVYLCKCSCCIAAARVTVGR